MCFACTATDEEISQVIKEAVTFLLDAATPEIRENIIACLSTCNLTTGYLVDEDGAVCLIGTGIPKERRDDFIEVDELDLDELETWFDQSVIYRDHGGFYDFQKAVITRWDPMAKRVGIDKARTIALEAVNGWKTTHAS